jgi:hydroxymethylbilane synthase
VAALEHSATRACLAAERAFAARLQGSCQSPVAGFAQFAGDRLHVRGLVGAPDGSQVFADEITGGTGEAAALGDRLASRLLEAGAGPLLAALRAGPGG